MKVKRLLCALLATLMVVSVVPSVAFAANDYVASETDDYYKLISKKDYELAPGITESEIVLNNDALSHRQVAHVVEVDMNNPYTKVLPSYKGMIPTEGQYGVQIMSQQAKWAEENGYGNVVAAMNISLSWYDSQYYINNPHLVGEPLGYMILDGVMYENSQHVFKEEIKDPANGGCQTCVVINFDEKDGVARPDDIPKVQIRSIVDVITGWEEQVIPANFGYLVKDGKNQYPKNHSSDPASRSFVGIKADGTFVMVMNDGRQAPYSTGFNSYEMAEFMLSLGCVAAINGDGGGSSTFLSQRPGEELKLNCSPSDGAERPTTHGILVISTAPATGEFVRATISAPADYYTPGSSVQFTAIGTDLVGTKAEIPAGAMWQLADESMGTIDPNTGLFTSNGTVGKVTAQMVYEENVVGEASINVVIPTEISFRQAVMTVPFDKEVDIAFNVTINGGLHDVAYKASDFILTTTNSALGTFDGLKFTSVSEENAPEDLTSTLTATFAYNADLVVTAALNLGKGSEILFDFEDENCADEWNIADVNGNDDGFTQELSFATSENGKVHDGNGSLKVFMNPVSAPGISAGGYAQSDLYLNEGIIVENAKSIGFWVYVPEDYVHMWIRVLYWYDPDGDGKYDKKNTITVINQPEVYNTVDESGWKYFSVDVSAYSSVLIPGLDCKDKISYANGKNDANNFRFIEFMFPHTNTNDIWKTYGTINGNYTVYIDNISADFSDAIDDRDAPIFSKIELAGDNDKTVELKKHEVAVLATSNNLNVNAIVAENTTKTNATGIDKTTAKAYVDGVEVPVTYANGRMSISNVAVADGYHRVKFEIADYMGNKAVIIRVIKVESGVKSSTVKVVPKDPTLDSLYGGSLYWMNVVATNIDTIEEIKMVLDLNALNHWELDHMELADGFTAEYSIDEEANTATIVIKREGNVFDFDEAVVASLPIRVVYYDTDIHIEGYTDDKGVYHAPLTAEEYWNEYGFWPYDVKVDVDLGEITYVNGYTSNVLGAFSNEEFSVDTELQTAFSDPEFKAERGTAHVHTETSVEKAPTCTEDGYTGRTYCEVCDSVVNWGEVVPATGHSYEVTEDGLYTCDDCKETRYYVDGEYIVGWNQIDGKMYYSDRKGVVANGEYTVGGRTYKFVDYVLTAPAWEHDSIGLTAYWADKLVQGGWHTYEGKQYFFTGIYANTGVSKVALSTNLGWRYYVFDDEGVWQENKTGIVESRGELYYAENGVCTYAGLVRVENPEAKEGYDYYYFNSSYKAVKSCTYNISNSKANGLLEPGQYTFGADGRIIFPNTDNDGLQFLDNGDIVYIENGEPVYKGVVEDEEGNLYYINSSKKAVKNCKYGITASKINGYDLEPGVYDIDENGHIQIPDPEKMKNGVLKDEDGEIRCYVNDVATYAGLVVYTDEDGKEHKVYINSSKKAVKSCKYGISSSKANGLVEAGTYEFDANGYLVELEPKDDGLYFEDGEIVYYKNNAPIYAGLVKHERKEGEQVVYDYYYINSSLKAVKNCKYYISTSKLNGIEINGVTLKAGTYEFGPDGKMIVENNLPEDGIHKLDNGDIVYLEKGQPVYKGLVLGKDGYYYYFNSSKKAVKSCTYGISEAKANGLKPAGDYKFDENGHMIISTTENDGVKMITKNETIDGVELKPGDVVRIKNGKLTYAGVVELDGNKYYINSTLKSVKNCTYGISASKTNGLIEAGVYKINAEGIIQENQVEDTSKTGINFEEGYYYENGIRTYGGVIKHVNEETGEIEYYYANSTGKIVKNCSYSIPLSKTNGLIEKGTYKFDENGKMINPKVIA